MKNLNLTPVDQLFQKVNLENLNFKNRVLDEHRSAMFLKRSASLLGGSTACLFAAFLFMHFFGSRPQNSFIPIDQINAYTEQMTKTPEANLSLTATLNENLATEKDDKSDFLENSH
jgi:hypothetical protein